jgi:hypothetical protein
VTVNITDNDTGGTGPPPGAGDEGSYAGSKGGGAVPDGGFGYGRNRSPMLAGPFVHGTNDLRVHNVVHRQRLQATTADEQRTVPVWSMAVTGVVLALAALVVKRGVLQ